VESSFRAWLMSFFSFPSVFDKAVSFNLLL
jgi:hypothetical protein